MYTASIYIIIGIKFWNLLPSSSSIMTISVTFGSYLNIPAMKPAMLDRSNTIVKDSFPSTSLSSIMVMFAHICGESANKKICVSGGISDT